MKRQGYMLLCLALIAIIFMAGRHSGRLLSDGHQVTSEQFQHALQSRDWAYRARVIGGFVVELDPQNLPEALAAVEDRKRWLSQDELRLFMGAWASFDPSGAFERSLTWPDHTRNKGAAAAIYGWALHDPAQAHKAAMTVSDTSLQALLLDRIVAAWAHRENREGLTLYIANLPEGPVRERLTRILIREILSEGHLAVMEWAVGIPAEYDPVFKSVAFAKVAGILAQDDHRAAAEFVERNRGASWSAGGYSAVARRWANKDPEAALAWARSLSEDTVRDQAVRTAFIQWQKSNPTLAEKWLFSAEPGPELDPARFVIARKMAATSPRRAVELAREISDPALKRESLATALSHWLQIDPPSANRWLAENPVAEATRRHLQNKVQAGRRGQGSREEEIIPSQE
ncbi:MAG: hypothetical protein P8Q97_12330 [Myxococcota bacterium]|nr:hypothetical protein [Myxococcota bacterium]